MSGTSSISGMGMTEEQFFSYFREVTPLKEGEKIDKPQETVLTLEDLATNDMKSYENFRNLLESAGIPKSMLGKIDVDRGAKRAELSILTDEEKLEKDFDKYVAEQKKLQLQQKSICDNFDYINSSASVLTDLEEDGEYNIVIIDPAYEAFTGYGEKKYTGSGLSLRIYKKFGLFGEVQYQNISPGNASFNIKTRELKPKVKGLIHAVGPGPNLRFTDFYDVLDRTIQSIFDIVKGLLREGTIDKETKIRIPLISAGEKSGGNNVEDKINNYYPRFIESIKKHFSLPITEENKECKLINPVVLYFDTDEGYTEFELYKNVANVTECWVYDFDGVVHNAAITSGDEKLEELKFDQDWEVLKGSYINNDIIQDMKKGEGFARIKIVSGDKDIFKESAYLLLKDQGININKSDVHFGVKNKFSALQQYIAYKIPITRFVDDFWGNIQKAHKLFREGALPGLKFLDWYSDLSKQLIPIDLYLPLPDLRRELAEETFKSVTDVDQRNFLQNAYDLFLTYFPGFQFPEWSIYYVMQNFQSLRATTVYYDEGDDLSLVKRLVREREPVNIGADRAYDPSVLNSRFGYSYGYYDIYFDEKNGKILPPNIAIFCKTPVKNEAGELITNKMVNIINSIGYAFDSENQSDYKYFSLFKRKNPDGTYTYFLPDDKKKELKEKYEKVFNKIFQCACDKKCDTIVFSLIGAASFATLYANGVDERLKQNIAFVKEIFAPCFDKIKNKYPKEITIVFMGSPKGTVNELNFFRDNGFDSDYKDIGFFPGNLSNVTNLDKTLFVNAWDMASVPGNGNARDNSLDGRIGRKSAIGVLSIGLTNPYLEKDQNYKSCQDVSVSGYDKDCIGISLPVAPSFVNPSTTTVSTDVTPAQAPLQATFRDTFKLMSWNILYKLFKGSRGTSYPKSKKKIYDYIDTEKPDILFTQESVFEKSKIGTSSGGSFGVSTVKIISENSANSITWNKEKFEHVLVNNKALISIALRDDKSLLWFNRVRLPTFDIGRLKADRPILATKLKHRDTGKNFIFASVWAPHGLENSDNYFQHIQKAGTSLGMSSGDRVIVAGDFNEYIENGCSETVDISRNIKLYQKQGDPTCCGNTNIVADGDDLITRSVNQRFDLFFDSKKGKNFSYTKVGDSRTSDHKPIIAVVNIENKPVTITGIATDSGNLIENLINKGQIGREEFLKRFPRDDILNRNISAETIFRIFMKLYSITVNGIVGVFNGSLDKISCAKKDNFQTLVSDDLRSQFPLKYFNGTSFNYWSTENGGYDYFNASVSADDLKKCKDEMIKDITEFFTNSSGEFIEKKPGSNPPPTNYKTTPLTKVVFDNDKGTIPVDYYPIIVQTDDQNHFDVYLGPNDSQKTVIQPDGACYLRSVIYVDLITYKSASTASDIVSSPLKIIRNRYLSPTTKIKASRNKKKNRLKKLKVP